MLLFKTISLTVYDFKIIHRFYNSITCEIFLKSHNLEYLQNSEKKNIKSYTFLFNQNLVDKIDIIPTHIEKVFFSSYSRLSFLIRMLEEYI